MLSTSNRLDLGSPAAGCGLSCNRIEPRRTTQSGTPAWHTVGQLFQPCRHDDWASSSQEAQIDFIASLHANPLAPTIPKQHTLACGVAWPHRGRLAIRLGPHQTRQRKAENTELGRGGHRIIVSDREWSSVHDHPVPEGQLWTGRKPLETHCKCTPNPWCRMNWPTSAHSVQACSLRTLVMALPQRAAISLHGRRQFALLSADQSVTGTDSPMANVDPASHPNTTQQSFTAARHLWACPSQRAHIQRHSSKRKHNGKQSKTWVDE